MYTKLSVILCIVLCIFHKSHAKTTPDPNAPKVLVFGGNRFLGSETVELLIASGYNVTIVNRGHKYWDSEEKIYAHVNSIKCDRSQGFKNCEDLINLVQDKTIYFDAVVDFSAFQENYVKEAADIVKDKVGLYIMKSMDLIYDVCDIRHVQGGSVHVHKEDETVRPKNESLRDSLKTIHTLGHNSLAAEEELVSQRENRGVPYVILRVPDLIGPKDDSFGYRFWMYQLWIKIQSMIGGSPVTMPDIIDEYPFSMAYSPDVAALIARLVKKDIEADDEIFNLGWPKPKTLKELLQQISSELQRDTELIVVPQTDRRYRDFWYPQTKSGPMDISKAILKLNWSPSPWKQAVRDTVRFYESAMKNKKYKTQMNEVIQVLQYRIQSKAYEHQLYDILENLYDISLKHFKISHDEL